MSESESLIVREAAPLLPRDVIDRAVQQAEILADVIVKKNLSVKISGRQYVKVEGWTPLARMNGVIPREVSVEEMEGGRYVALVALVRISDGVELTRASAECGGPEDETWDKRPPNARRSMAITRATGKACRLAYSWIMSLAGYEPVPAEEVDENDEPLQRPPIRKPQAKARPPIETEQGQMSRPGEAEMKGNHFAFGKILQIEPPKPTSKGGSSWVFHCDDGNRYRTFSDTDADLAASFVKSGIRAVIEYKDGQYGRNCLAIYEQTVME